jgi:hypothetical protein
MAIPVVNDRHFVSEAPPEEQEETQEAFLKMKKPFQKNTLDRSNLSGFSKIDCEFKSIEIMNRGHHRPPAVPPLSAQESGCP